MMFNRLKRLTACATAVLFLAANAPAAPAGSSAGTAKPLPDLNLPSLGTVAGADLSLQDERDIGEALMKEIRSDKDYLADPEITDYLNRLGWRLVAAGSVPPFHFFFFPLRDRTLNAFALPGGFIAVHTGLLCAAQTESELAGVMGHEIGHVAQRHIARMINEGSDSLAITLGSILLAVLAAKAGGSSGGDAAVAIAMGTQGALLQKQLKFSRDAEREADRTGFARLVNAGFDPKGMEDFFGRLAKENRYYENDVTAFLSTHPLSTERMSDMQNRSRSVKRTAVASSLDFYLVRARARVLQETTYDGWLKLSRTFRDEAAQSTGREKAAAFYGLAASLTRMNKPAEALAAVRSARSAAGSSSIMLEKQEAELAYAAARTPAEKKAALAVARTMSRNYPDSAMAAQTCAELLWQAGDNAGVIAFLRQQTALTKSDPDYYALLARSYEALGKKSAAFSATGDMYARVGNHRAAVYQFDLAQKADDGDFYLMSEIDAKLREERRRVLDEKEAKKR